MGSLSKAVFERPTSNVYLNATNIVLLILLHEKFLQFDWLTAVVFQLNLKYLHVKITNLLWVQVLTNNIYNNICA